MPMSPGERFGWEEAAEVMVSVSCGHVCPRSLCCLGEDRVKYQRRAQ
jgi:hypothetical protein